MLKGQSVYAVCQTDKALMEAHSCFTPLESPAISCGRNESRGKECGWGPACMMHAAAVFSPGWLPWLSIFMPSALQGLPAGHHSRRLQPTLVCGSTAGTAAVAMSGVPAQAGPLLQVDAGAVADNEAGTSQWACHRLPATRHAHTHTHTLACIAHLFGRRSAPMAAAATRPFQTPTGAVGMAPALAAHRLRMSR